MRLYVSHTYYIAAINLDREEDTLTAEEPLDTIDANNDFTMLITTTIPYLAWLTLDEIEVNNDSATPMTTTIPNFDVKKTKVFFTTEKEMETNTVMVVNIPRLRHGEERCVEAKAREL